MVSSQAKTFCIMGFYFVFNNMLQNNLSIFKGIPPLLPCYEIDKPLFRGQRIVVCGPKKGIRRWRIR